MTNLVHMAANAEYPKFTNAAFEMATSHVLLGAVQIFGLRVAL